VCKRRKHKTFVGELLEDKGKQDNVKMYEVKGLQQFLLISLLAGL
jgi:hypothetical protein